MNAEARPTVRGAACINAEAHPTVRGAADESFSPRPFFKKAGARLAKVFRLAFLKSQSLQNPRQPRCVCHGFCLGQAKRLNRCLAACGPRWRARPVRGSLTAGRFACPAGYSGLSGANSTGRGQAAAAPLSAPHGTGAGRPYPVDPTLGRAQSILTRRPTHYSRRSRLKFFGLPFFQKR